MNDRPPAFPYHVPRGVTLPDLPFMSSDPWRAKHEREDIKTLDQSLGPGNSSCCQTLPVVCGSQSLSYSHSFSPDPLVSMVRLSKCIITSHAEAFAVLGTNLSSRAGSSIDLNIIPSVCTNDCHAILMNVYVTNYLAFSMGT